MRTPKVRNIRASKHAATIIPLFMGSPFTFERRVGSFPFSKKMGPARKSSLCDLFQFARQLTRKIHSNSIKGACSKPYYKTRYRLHHGDPAYRHLSLLSDLQ